MEHRDISPAGIKASDGAAAQAAQQQAAQPAEPRERIILAPGERRAAILELIRSARERLILSVFRCTDFKILDELAEARRRNVEVRVLITRRAKGWKKRLGELCRLLESMGATVHRYAGAYSKYHAKYMVADDATALVASLNFTGKCLDRTCDFLLITPDHEVISGLQKLFYADWQAPLSSFPDDLGGRLVVAPELARTQIAALLCQAKHSIRIVDHRLLDPEMVSLLRGKQAEGVSVEVLSRGSLGGLLSHGKMILVDEKTAVIGSISLSGPSLDSRREVAAVIRDSECVQQLNRFFLSMSSQQPAAVAVPAGIDEEEEEEDEE